MILRQTDRRCPHAQERRQQQVRVEDDRRKAIRRVRGRPEMSSVQERAALLRHASQEDTDALIAIVDNAACTIIH